MSNNSNQRRILLDLAVSLDGFIEGKNGEIDWCIMEPEMDFTEFLKQIDTILYGRKSYDLWGEFASQTPDESDKEMWDLIHSKDKIVFSKTQTTSTDPKVRYINENIMEEVVKLKNQPGKDIWLYGGSDLITTFINLGIVDEFRLSVHPVILGGGKPLFIDIEKRINLHLVDTRRFPSGVVQLIYHWNGQY